MMKKPRKLRWQLALSMLGTVMLLWAALMGIFTYNTSMQMKSDVKNTISDTLRSMESSSSIYGTYSGTGEGAKELPKLREWLSRYTGNLIDVESGMALCIYDDNNVELIRSQLAYGWGQEDIGATAQRWYLQFDGGLGDQEQLDLADWIADHRGGAIRGYKLSAPELNDSGVSCDDGTTARVTGIVQGDHDLAVQRIELLHPDGSTEALVETTYEGENPLTLNFKYLEVNSALVPVSDRLINRGVLLARFREAQAILDRNQAGEEQSVLTSDGALQHGIQHGGFSSIAWDYSNFGATLYQLRWVYAGSLAVALLLLFFLSNRLSRRVSTPIEELYQAVEGRWRCEDRSPIVEVNALATAFNTAQMKMANDLKREQDLTRAVAHELKTPLAILRSHAEALSEDIDPAKRSAYLNIIMDESDRMAALVGELLDLSRMEAGAEKLSREEVDLKTLTERVFARIAELAHVSLALEPIIVSGDPKLLERAISNYASNALRHCAEGGVIRVTLRREGGNAVLTVENDGDPIPPEALPHLWDTFYKADTARTRTGGTGLGLAIVRSIAALHGGSCAVENHPGAVAFTLTLSCIPTDSVV